MKKLVGLLMIAAMMLSLCGCMSVLNVVSKLGDQTAQATGGSNTPQTGYATAQECMEAALAVDHKFVVLPKEQHRKMYSEEHWEILIQYAGLEDYDEFYNKYAESVASYAEVFQDADISYQVASELTVTLEDMYGKNGVPPLDEDDREMIEKIVGTRNPKFREVTYKFEASISDKNVYTEYGVFYFYERDDRWYVFKL